MHLGPALDPSYSAAEAKGRQKIVSGYRTLPQPSRVLGVSLPRPMGVVLEEDARRGRVVVGGFIEGSVAEKRAKVRPLVPLPMQTN